MKTLETLNKFDDIIESIEIIEFVEEEHVSKLKIKTKLVDASYFWIREIKRRSELIAYSYYWLRSNGTVIIGWDNAPHHPEIENFPHHKHIGKKVEPSHDTNLEDILDFIKKYYY